MKRYRVYRDIFRFSFFVKCFLDHAIYDAYTLYKSANNKTGTLENFHLLVIKDILQTYPPRRVEAKRGAVQFGRPSISINGEVFPYILHN